MEWIWNRESDMNIEVWIALLIMVFGPAGAAWVGVKVALNGLKSKVNDLSGAVEKLNQTILCYEHRISRLEAKHE